MQSFGTMWPLMAGAVVCTTFAGVAFLLLAPDPAPTTPSPTPVVTPPTRGPYVGGYVPPTLPPRTQAPTPNPTRRPGMTGFDCRTWQPCWTSVDPDACCKSKASSCPTGDGDCKDGRFAPDLNASRNCPACPVGGKCTPMCAKGRFSVCSQCQGACMGATASEVVPGWCRK